MLPFAAKLAAIRGHDMSGVFIAFEGGEGAGKSTQARLLQNALVAEGYRSLPLHEPGSTELGNYLRAYLVDGHALSSPAELLLFAAARAELVNSVIAPELTAGSIVIADRFAGSTVAYQGYGRGLNLAQIAWLNDFATAGRYPDLTILLDIDPVTGMKRVRSRQLELGIASDAAPNRFEDEALAFHRAVRRGFLEQAAAHPERWRQIDGRLPIEEVAGRVWNAVSALLNPSAAAV